MMVNRFCSEITRRGVLLFAAALCAPLPARADDRLVVFAAASLKPALDAIVADWPGGVALSYGGSGTLARQIAAGAPADIVILAATDWMDWLASKGVLDGAPVPVAGNRLVLVGPPGAAPVTLDAPALLERLGESRLAMGDPMSVPAGRYAQQALETLGLWSGMAPKALYAEDVRAALAFVARGDVPLAMVYASDARGTGVSLLAEVPAAAHAPIVYPGAIVAGARDGARALLDHIAGARAAFSSAGFAP